MNPPRKRQKILQQARRDLARGDIDNALIQWRQITSDQPTPDECLEALQVLWALYRFTEAVDVQDCLLQHQETRPSHCLAVAKALFSRNRIRESARFTRRALELDPGNPDIAAMHAASLERSGSPAEALELLETTLRQHPRHLRAVRLLSHIERLHGDRNTAIHRLQNHLSSGACDEDWRLLYELAPALESSGDHAGAIRSLKAAKQQLAPQALPHYQPWRDLTNRQWQLTASIDRARIDRWNASANELLPPLRICLLAGFPRSGTTLLENILASHPECIGTDESGILATQFRDPLVLLAADTSSALAELDSLDAEALADGRGEYLRSTCEYLGESLGGRILIEKEPLLTADLALPLRLFPEAKILMPLRDPRDVVISFFFTIVPLAANSVAAADLGECCRYYAEVMRHWLHFREILPNGRWMESRYEDLLADPELQTRRLAAFLGLEWMPSMLNHHLRTDPKAVSTPTYAEVSKPLYSRAMKRWVPYQQWLEPHLHHLEPYLKAFGYDLNPP